MSIKKYQQSLREHVCPRCHLEHDANVELILTHRADVRRATVILYYGTALRRCYVPLLSTSILGDVRHTLTVFRNCGFSETRNDLAIRSRR